MTMATIKSYTDIEQSKVLAKILPLESADMYYTPPLIKGHTDYIPHLKRKLPIDWDIEQAIPCWSLAALLDVLPNGTNITKDEADTENEKYMCVAEAKGDIVSTFGNNPVDACVETIEKLNELKML